MKFKFKIQQCYTDAPTPLGRFKYTISYKHSIAALEYKRGVLV